MPRQARIDIPGLLHHVMIRGIERRNIFEDDADREHFLKRFSVLLTETGTICLAWALIPNHAHFLLRPEGTELGLFMRRLLTSHAIRFNRRHQRVGHLFQNRYKSLVCENDPYLLELVRYIHLNPLRANLVHSLAELDQYPWSGHSVLLGKNRLDGQEVDEVLALFASHQGSACRLYHQFVQDGIGQGRRDDLSPSRSMTPQPTQTQDGVSRDGRVLGSEFFMESLAKKHGRNKKKSVILPLADLLQRLASHYGVDPEALRQRSQAAGIRHGRDVFCYVAIRVLRRPGPEVGEYLHIKRSAVSHAVRRGGEFIRADDEILRKAINLNN